MQDFVKAVCKLLMLTPSKMTTKDQVKILSQNQSVNQSNLTSVPKAD